jgi:hypothetical protein
MKEASPIQYAVINKVAEEPAFAWWVKRQDRISITKVILATETQR